MWRRCNSAATLRYRVLPQGEVTFALATCRASMARFYSIERQGFADLKAARRKHYRAVMTITYRAVIVPSYAGFAAESLARDAAP